MQSLQGEVQLNIPASQAWEMFTSNEIVSKVNPDMLCLAGAEYLEGDGSPGSLRLFRLGPVVLQLLPCRSIITNDSEESVQKTEKVEPGRCIGYEAIRGELKMYDTYFIPRHLLLRPCPGKEGKSCIAGWKAEFDPTSSTTPQPENAEDASLGFLRQLETCSASN
ncbi:hypothetical protein PVAP13_6KG225000 [Panicum virgatum]|uniref:Uncharacterized protein n=1 Tax=Panicum virgatum TaxID=38727 RepID=A0A8T0RDF7_PANVG|nr:hypothetical protein PVAP13_6KG225000 [Panicum virgatum]